MSLDGARFTTSLSRYGRLSQLVYLHSPLRSVGCSEERRPDPLFNRSRTIGLPADTLNGNTLRCEHLVLQRVHACGGFIDPACECDGSLQDRLQAFAILNASRRILMFDDQVCVRNIQRQEFAGCKLVIKPIDRPILQISQRIVACRTGQFVFAKHDLFLPGMELVLWPFRRFVADPVAAFQRLSAVSPGCDSLGIDDLTLNVESANEKTIALVFQVLKDGASVLAHENRVRGIVVNSKLIADPVLLANAMQRDPSARRVGDVVMKIVIRGPTWHRALLYAERETAFLGGFQQRNEMLFEVDQVLIHAVVLIPPHESTNRIHSQQ